MMSRLTKTFLSILLVFFVLNNVYSQWQNSQGLDGAELKNIVSIDSMLFTLTPDGSIHKKIDSGTWQPINEWCKYSSIEKVGNALFAYNPFNYCISARSFDYGDTWETPSNISGMNLMFSIDTVLFFGDYIVNKRSFDYGETVEAINLPFVAYQEIFCDDSLLYLHTQDGEDYDEHNLYYSNDYGSTWFPIAINGLYSNPYAMIEKVKYLNGAFWLQTDSGSTGLSSKSLFVFNSDLNEWIDVTNNLPHYRTYNDLFYHNGDILCAIESYPVFKFDYSDSSWVQYADPTKSINKFLMHNNQLFCATDQGACSLDTNGNWTTFYEGMQYRNITSIDYLGNDIYAVANDELFHSTDAGITFTRKENAYGHQLIIADTIFYMISRHDFILSVDSGNTWQSHSDSIEDGHNPYFNNISISPEFLYLATNRGLFKSSIDSISWSKVEDSNFGSWFRANHVEAIDTTVLVMEGYLGFSLFYSNDNGSSFSVFDDYCNYAIATVDSTYYFLNDSLVFSDDLGQSWDTIPFSTTNGIKFCLDKKADTLLVGGVIGTHPSIEMTYDMGENWFDLTDNLPDPQTGLWTNWISTVKIIDGKIFLGNPGNGLWFRDDILTTTNENPWLNSNNNTLEIINYPNPFSHSTNIEYTLESSALTSIIIYNQFGQQVEMFRQQQTKGKHSLTWNTRDKKAGTYFLQIEAGGKTGLKKMIMIK